LDRTLQALERAWRDERDLDAARELARVRLRAGRPLAALSLARVGGDPQLHTEAAQAVGDAASVALARLEDGFEVFTLGGQELVLIPGGVFLEEQAERAETSLLRSGGGQRAPLRPVHVPDLLVGLRALTERDPLLARDAAHALGARLPTPLEWKKAWRGGIYLDGDETELRPHARPDQLGPWGLGDPPADSVEAFSPYGIHFLSGCWEHTQGGNAGMGFSAGRYRISLATSADRRNRQLTWRPVLELDLA